MSELVPTAELAAVLGIGGHDELLVGYVKELGHIDITDSIEKDWCGRASVPVKVAAEVTSVVTGAVERHNERWFRYEQYLRDRNAAAQAERDAIAQKARDEAAKENQNKSEAVRRQNEEEARRHLEAEQEKARRKRGNPVDFANFTENGTQRLVERTQRAKRG